MKWLRDLTNEFGSESIPGWIVAEAVCCECEIEFPVTCHIHTMGRLECPREMTLKHTVYVTHVYENCEKSDRQFQARWVNVDRVCYNYDGTFKELFR